MITESSRWMNYKDYLFQQEWMERQEALAIISYGRWVASKYKGQPKDHLTQEEKNYGTQTS